MNIHEQLGCPCALLFGLGGSVCLATLGRPAPSLAAMLLGPLAGWVVGVLIAQAIVRCGPRPPEYRPRLRRGRW